MRDSRFLQSTAGISKDGIKFFARAAADVTLKAGPVELGVGLGADTGIAIGKGGVEAKVLGTGFAVTKERVEVCFQICIAFNFGLREEPFEPDFEDQFGNETRSQNKTARRKAAVELMSYRMAVEWHNRLTMRKSLELDAEKLLKTLTVLIGKAIKDVEQQSGRSLKSLCKGTGEMKKECDMERKALLNSKPTEKKTVMTKFKTIEIKKGEMGTDK